MKRKLQLDVTLPIYDVPAGKCLVPAGLEARTVHPSETCELRATVMVAGLVAGFVCKSDGLRVTTMRVGRNRIEFSSAGFDSVASAEGIAIPARRCLPGEEIAATFESYMGVPVTVWAYFWIETDRQVERPFMPRSRSGS